MTKEEALQIIKDEGLIEYNWFEDHKNGSDEVGIKKAGDKWEVYTTDERAWASPESVWKYDSESEALEDFIDRLRAGKRWREYHKINFG